MKYQSTILTTIALSSLIFAGCSSPSYDKVKVAQHWQAGEVSQASAEIQTGADPENVEKSDDSILWELNAGLISGLDNDFVTSSDFFERAMVRAKTGFIKEEESLDAGTMISRWWSSEYEATQQEVNMIPVYQIFNSFRDNAPANDIVGTARSVIEVQERAGTIHKKRIVAQLQELEKKPAFGDLDKAFSAMGKKPDGNAEYNKKEEISALEAQLKEVYGPDFKLNFGGDAKQFVDPRVAIWLNGVFHEVNPDSLDFKNGASLATVVNPFATWLASSILLADANTEEDFETVRALRRNAVEVSQGKSVFLNKAFIKVCKNDLSKTTNTTYVIYEGGQAPEVVAQPVNVRIPDAVLVISGILAEFGGVPAGAIPKEGQAFFPKAKSRGDVPALDVNGTKTEVVVDFDKIVDDQFRAESLEIADNSVFKLSALLIGRGVVLVTANIALESAKKNSKGKNDFALKAAETAYKLAKDMMVSPLELGKPDTRHWDYLPRTLEVAKMPTPADGKLNVFGEQIDVPAKGVTFVRVRKDSENWPTVVQVFPFPQDLTGPLGGDDGDDSEIIIPNLADIPLPDPVEELADEAVPAAAGAGAAKNGAKKSAGTRIGGNAKPKAVSAIENEPIEVNVKISNRTFEDIKKEIEFLKHKRVLSQISEADYNKQLEILKAEIGANYY